MQNNDVRMQAISKGIKLWEIASILGITDATFSRRLRKELTEEEKQEIFAIIDKLAQKEDT